jgi:hypothetical protein
MTVYQRETVELVIDEIGPLLEKHWREIARYRDLPLVPHWDGYYAAQEAGRLYIFTARRQGTLVGYAVFFKGHMHYRSSQIYTQDILYVLPECRGMIGARLLKFCDDSLKAEGAQAVYHHCKTDHDFGPLLKKMGYEAIDTVYGRRF